MKKMLIAITIITTGLLFSCGGGDDDAKGGTLTIDSEGVKGTIEAGEYKKSNKLHYGKQDAWVIGYGTSELAIIPTDKTLADLTKNIESENSFGSKKIEFQDETTVLVKEVRMDFKTKEVKEEGYSFLMVIDGFMFKGTGENPLMPIKDKAEAEKLIKIAKTFKKS